jgi:hypothetical protein
MHVKAPDHRGALRDVAVRGTVGGAE